MKNLSLFFCLAFSIFAFPQKIYYEKIDGKILDENTFNQEKNAMVEKMKKNLPSEAYFDILYNLEKPKIGKDSIIYKVKNMIFSRFPPEINYKNNFNKNNLIGKTLPFNTLQTLNDTQLTLENLKGKPSLINFWYTGCGPCIKEMPFLNELKEKFSDKINFISITFDTKDKVEKFLKTHQFNYLHVVNAADFMNAIQFKEFPKTFYLDKNGMVVKIDDVFENPEQKTETENYLNALL